MQKVQVIEKILRFGARSHVFRHLIIFEEIPAKRVAAIRFGGWANDEKIEQYKQKLISELEKEGITHSNKFYFLGYNAPYDFINRKNDIIVEL